MKGEETIKGLVGRGCEERRGETLKFCVMSLMTGGSISFVT